MTIEEIDKWHNGITYKYTNGEWIETEKSVYRINI